MLWFTQGVFRREEVRICTGAECGVVLNEESSAESRCQTCGIDLTSASMRREPRYRLERPRSHDVGWLIALHGIRTHGVWQEQLQWLIDRQFRRTVPFRNWKYGRILFSALIPVLQRRLVRRFLIEVRMAQTELENILSTGEAPPPDLIAHSFGTWIVAHALASDPHPSARPPGPRRVDHPTRTGRGMSRLKPSPTHGCTQLLRRPRSLEWGSPERFIPDLRSGSGTVGFTEPHEERLTNVLRPGGTHGSAFTRALLNKRSKTSGAPSWPIGPFKHRCPRSRSPQSRAVGPVRLRPPASIPAPALPYLALLSARGSSALAIWG